MTKIFFRSKKVPYGSYTTYGDFLWPPSPSFPHLALFCRQFGPPKSPPARVCTISYVKLGPDWKIFSVIFGSKNDQKFFDPKRFPMGPTTHMETFYDPHHHFWPNWPRPTSLAKGHFGYIPSEKKMVKKMKISIFSKMVGKHHPSVRT